MISGLVDEHCPRSSVPGGLAGLNGTVARRHPEESRLARINSFEEVDVRITGIAVTGILACALTVVGLASPANAALPRPRTS
jgi:hypothetical protein